MTDIIVKIMVEVLSILGIVTKEIGQGRISMSFPVDLSPNSTFVQRRYLKKLLE
jgi:ABC-type transport system involved in Fe-S cluster assembly fused permease/ATPase subunit